ESAFAVAVYVGYAGWNASADYGQTAGHGLQLAKPEGFAAQVAGHTENIGRVVEGNLFVVGDVPEEMHATGYARLFRLGAQSGFHVPGAAQQQRGFNLWHCLYQVLQTLV